MANGIKTLRQIQTGRESSGTQGTAPATFSNWRGTGTLQDSRESVFPNEDIGIFGGVDRQYFPKLESTLSMDEVEATFEQIPHIFDASIFKVDGVADGIGSGKVRTYTWPILAADAKVSTDLQTYSFKCGDNNEIEKTGYCFVTDFTLIGNAGEAWKIQANWRGQEVTPDTGGWYSGTIPTVEEMLFSKTKLYIDEPGGTQGTTLISSTLISATIKVTTGWRAVYTASGSASFGFLKLTPTEISVDLTFEHNATATAEKAKWRAGTGRLFRFTTEGAALTTSSGYVYKSLIQNYAGKWDSFDKIGEQDGNDIVTGHFKVRYDPTASKYASIIVVNEIAAMP
jgi:hypothetical protein